MHEADFEPILTIQIHEARAMFDVLGSEGEATKLESHGILRVLNLSEGGSFICHTNVSVESGVLPVNLKATQKQLLLLFLSSTLTILGILDGEYDLVRNFVRFICSSCIGLG